MEYKDFYKTLGVERSASAEEIKKAYRKLVRKHHPDVSKAKDADHKTKEINEAYAVLGDAEKRAAYDALGSGMRGGQQFQPPPDWGGSPGRQPFGAGGFSGNFGQGDFGGEDFFSDLFAHVGRRTRGGPAGARRGEDIHATIGVGLQDIYHGTTHTVSLRVPTRDASGRVGVQDRQVSVTIPKGIVPGQQVRVAGQGQPGSQGGPPGDLLLEVQLRDDERYRVEGRNVTAPLPVAPWEAALGAVIEVPTPSGQVSVTVPAGSQHGRKLRLKGRGLPGHPSGDLYLELEVVLPPANSARARELYSAMARDLAFNPRSSTRA